MKAPIILNGHRAPRLPDIRVVQAVGDASLQALSQLVDHLGLPEIQGVDAVMGLTFAICKIIDAQPDSAAADRCRAAVLQSISRAGHQAPGRKIVGVGK